jgi:hypothetical protein
VPSGTTYVKGVVSDRVETSGYTEARGMPASVAAPADGAIAHFDAY